MLDFICIGFAELSLTGSKQKIQKKKYMPPPGIGLATPCVLACRSYHSTIETVDDIRGAFGK